MRHLKDQIYKHIQNANYFIQKHSSLHNLTITKKNIDSLFLAFFGGNIYNFIFLTPENKS